jgi:hypothetical protein
MRKVCLILLLVGGLASPTRAPAQVRFGIPLPFPFLVWSGGRGDNQRQHQRKDGDNGSSYSRPHYYYDEGYHRRYYSDGH